MNQTSTLPAGFARVLGWRGWSRLLEAALTLMLLALLCFALLHAAPGGPFDGEREFDPALRARLIAEYRLDQPWLQQFLHYLGGALRGDFGHSFQYPDYRVSELLVSGFAVTATLGGIALLLASLLGVAAGSLAAWTPGGVSDRCIGSASLLGLALPKFVLAPLLILAFAVGLGWLPAGGFDWQQRATWVLPIVTLALPNLAAITRLSRDSVQGILASAYLRAARARGIEGLALYRRHVLRPLALGVLGWLGPALIAVLTGSTVVEQIFGLPGVGRYFVQGALNRDYSLVMGVALAAGALIVLTNLLIDGLRAWLDPRLRSEH